MTRILIGVILIFGIVVVGYVYLFPEWQKFQGLKQETKDLQAINQELDVLTQNRDTLIEAINRISKDDLDRIDQSMPQGQQAASLLVYFESLAGKNGLALKSIDLSEKVQSAAAAGSGSSQPKPGGAVVPAPQTSLSSIKDFPLTMHLIGTYDSFKGFLRALEKSSRIIDVKTVVFASSGVGGVFNFTVQAKTYYQ